ncbi:hypothetical protein [Psychrobacillus sp. NPDC093180]|uniref:hypothetical protein n=1 Tax=Psychrobacillus sp. NPDC093180 TaxID=3364489 RepID=UPI0037FBA774
MAIISATLVIQGKSLETGNLFFQTFKKNSIHEWKLARSYIEAGIPCMPACEEVKEEI